MSLQDWLKRCISPQEEEEEKAMARDLADEIDENTIDLERVARRQRQIANRLRALQVQAELVRRERNKWN